MIHLYDNRKYASLEFRLLCTKVWVKTGVEDKPVTVPHNVSCPKCLEILIPKEQAKVDEMKRKLENAKQAEAVLEAARAKEALPVGQNDGRNGF